MHISQLTLHNFKKFGDLTVDTSAPLTYLLGPNSSGKSSIIKAILGLKQTVSIANESEGFSTQGEYVDLGTYQDFIYKHNKKSDFSLGLTLKPNKGEEVHLRFGRVSRSVQSACYSFTFDYNAVTEQPRVRSVTITTQLTGLETPLVLTIDRKTTRDTYRLKVVRSFLDTSQLELFPDQRTRVRYWITGLDVMHVSRLLFRRARTRSAEMYSDASIIWMQILLNQFVRSLSEETFYIGPIRSSPSRNYIRTSHSRAVGPHGEFTASVLANLSKRLKKVTTGSSSLQSQFAFLTEALNALFPGKGFTPKTLQELVRLEFFDVQPDANQRPRGESIIDVGFGFSQIFPILVQLAVMPTNSLLIVEQPELHLHPIAQTQLAKVFELALRYGKRIIAETHSDHLIRGTQLFVADQGRLPEPIVSNSDITTIYTHSGDTAPIILKMLFDGSFDQPWPSGFMDQGYMTLLKMLKPS